MVALVTTKQMGPCKVELTIEVGIDEIKNKTEEVYRRIAGKAKIPGFRPGKAPRNLLEQYYSSEVEKEVLDQILPSAYQEALEQAQVEPVDTAVIGDIKYLKGEPLIFKAAVEIKPEIPVGDYRGILVEKKAIHISEEDVQKSLEFLREMHAEFVTIEDRPLQKGDAVIMDLQSFRGETPLQEKVVTHFIEVGEKRNLPQFEEQIIGLRKGEKKEFKIAYPSDYEDKEFAGQEITFKVQVKEIKEKKLPEINDKFAKDVGDYQNLEELQNKSRENLLRQAEKQQLADMNNQIMKRLIEKTNFEVPGSMVEKELNYLFQDLEKNMKNQHMTWENLGKTPEKAKEELQTAAFNRVKGELILNRIGEIEKVLVSEEELQAKMEKLAKEMNQSPKAVEDYFRAPNRLEVLKLQLLREKTFRFLRETADVVEV